MKQSLITILFLTAIANAQVSEVLVEKLRYEMVDSGTIKFTISFSRDIEYPDDADGLVCPWMCNDRNKFSMTEILNTAFALTEGIYVQDSGNQFVCASRLIPEEIRKDVFCNGIDSHSIKIFRKNKSYQLLLRTEKSVYNYFKNKNLIVIMEGYEERVVFCTVGVYKKIKDQANK